MNWNTYRQDNVNMTIGGKFPIKEWTVGVEIEDHARAQLHNVANLPFIYKHIAVMPDVHAGIGATIGSVIATTKAISPSMVGVDIGCGVLGCRTTLKKSMMPSDLAVVRKAIEQSVPHGFVAKGRDPGSWGNPPVEVNIAWEELEPGYKKLIEKCPKISHKNPVSQLGTLGSGNHFWECCYDENDEIWFLLHSGSRGPGNKIGQVYTQLAKDEMKKYYIELPDMALSYLPQGTDLFDNYMEAVKWAQRYAEVNRELMITLAEKGLRKSKLLPKFEMTDEYIPCHHNYVARENHFNRNVWVTRKGAISARKGQLGIILGSMATPSYIVRGKGNPDSFNSCSHGAGRKMSRTQAKQTFTLKDHRLATEGVECKKDSSVLDETPLAYKDIHAVMEAQKDLVEKVHELRQLISVKG